MITEVVAALIWKDNHFLICRRPENKKRGLLWEFPGGKIEPGETGEEALVRECREELDITLRVGTPCSVSVHEYPDLTVRVTLYNTVILKGIPKLLEHCDMRWITAEEIPLYEFCPADTVFFPDIIKQNTENA